MSDNKTLAPTVETTALASTQGKVRLLTRLADLYGIDRDRFLEVVRNTAFAAPKGEAPFSNEEVMMGLVICDQYKLNPFTGEIYLARMQGKVRPIVGVDGWAKAVNAHQQFDGMEFEEEEGPDGKPVSVTVTLWRKGIEHPIRVKERYSECYRDTGPWNGMPWRMLRHKALSQGARYGFGFTGLMDADDAAQVIDTTAEVIPNEPEPKSLPEPTEVKPEPEQKAKPRKKAEPAEPEDHDEKEREELRARIQKAQLSLPVEAWKMFRKEWENENERSLANLHDLTLDTLKRLAIGLELFAEGNKA